MKFRYARYGQVLRPVIPIKLKNGSQEIGYEVLVDSGADMCLFDAEIGEAIGINVKKGTLKTISGIGGKTSTYYLHKIKINVDNWEYDIEAGFMPGALMAGIPYGVVGQRGFFEFFKIIFDRAAEEVEIKRKAG